MSDEARDSHAEAHPRSLTSSDARLRKLTSWVTMLGTASFAAYFFGFLVYHSWHQTSASGSWLLAVLERQFAAAIAVPLSAIASVCIILLLKATTGPIEFEGLGFRFRGAAGPIVLWVFCFLAMVFAEHLLWKP